MVKTASPTADHDEGHVHDRRTHLVGQGIARGAGAATLAKARAGSKLSRWPANGLAHELISVAEQLIVRGKEQGYLTPDDILQGFPEIEGEPDQIVPVFAAFKEIGRFSLLTANDEVELAQAIEAKPLHDALKALSVVEEVEGRRRSLDEMLPDIIERLATVKRIGQQAYIAQELLGLADLSKLQSLVHSAAAERQRQANGPASSGQS